eukprot:5554399-Pyramimonas_sp.AAC.1
MALLRIGVSVPNDEGSSPQRSLTPCAAAEVIRDFAHRPAEPPPRALAQGMIALGQHRVDEQHALLLPRVLVAALQRSAVEPVCPPVAQVVEH